MVEQAPASPAYMVYGVFDCGTAHIVGYGPDSFDEACTMAARLNGVVVAVPVLADYR